MAIELINDEGNYRVKLDGRQIALFYVSGPIDEHYVVSRLTFEMDPESSGLPEIIGVREDPNLAKWKAHSAAVEYSANLEKRLVSVSS
ncbi:MAG: hypothetical protein AABX03_04525 [Nanoarchaeota archaeon]